MKFNKAQLGAIFAIVAGFLYGFLGFFSIRIMQEGVSIPNMMFWRFLISAIFISPFLLIKVNSNQKSLKEAMKALFFGAAFYCLSPIFFCMSARHISTGLSMVIFFIYPLIVMLINKLFYKQKISRIYYLALSAILIGMLFLVDMRSISFNLMGIIFSILSGAFYAFYIVGSKNNKIDPLFSTFMVSMGCAITSLIFALFDNSFEIPSNLTSWGYLLGYGTVCTAIPILIFLESLKYISSEKASILSVLEPVFVVIIGVLLLNESINSSQGIGIVCILTGALIALVDKKPIKQSSPLNKVFEVEDR